MSTQDLSEIIGKHIVYKYGGLGVYEAYFQNDHVIVYSIQSGPSKSRNNYQKAYYQKIRDHIYTISWVEETDTVITITVDFELMKITCFTAFSQGHWEKNEEAHGDKRNPSDFERWKKLAKIGVDTTRVVHLDAGRIEKVTEGPGNLKPVTEDMAFF